MARMPWNRRKPSVEVKVPPEVEEYYQSTHKDRRGMAWLLAFLTLIVTVLIAVVLFFAGRWAYRSITGDDNVSSSETEQSVQEDQATENPESIESDGFGSNTQDGSDESSDSSDSDALPSGPEPTGDSTDSGSGTNEGSDESTTSSTPTTGPGDSEIPRTGPTEE